jgi:dihydrofolate reductase
MTAPTPTLTLIAAIARNGVIGRDNALPWRLPEDLAHFKARTQGRSVLMGRQTWDSLPPRFRPLPGRRNLVLSRDARWHADGATRVGSLDEALALAAGESELVVIGGSQVYRLALPRADELVLTEIDAEVEGDAHFPDWPRAAFAEVSRQPRPADHGPAFAFVVYRRRSA